MGRRVTLQVSSHTPSACLQSPSVACALEIQILNSLPWLQGLQDVVPGQVCKQLPHPFFLPWLSCSWDKNQVPSYHRAFALTVPFTWNSLYPWPLTAGFHFVCLFVFKIRVKLLYNTVLISAIPWSESATRVHLSPLSWISLPTASTCTL